MRNSYVTLLEAKIIHPTMTTRVFITINETGLLMHLKTINNDKTNTKPRQTLWQSVFAFSGGILFVISNSYYFVFLFFWWGGG